MSKNKIFKIGDLVRVRRDLLSDKSYPMIKDKTITNSVVLQMFDLCGHLVEITHHTPTQYRINKDFSFAWTDTMFYDIYENGNLIISTDGTEYIIIHGRLFTKSGEEVFFNRDSLCIILNDKEVPIDTILSPSDKNNLFSNKNREIIFKRRC